MRQFIKYASTTFMLASLGMFMTSGLNSHAGAGVFGTPKISKHESFKPGEFVRLAVIVKPIQARQQGFDPSAGINLGGGIGKPRHDQTQLERLVEQRFMRVLLGEGYTLVSRADLDSAMKEKGLDEANLTDEKLTQEAGKFLQVSAIMVVSVDDFKITPQQRVVAKPTNPGPFGNLGGQQTAIYYQVVASVSARLVKISDNMVMWTGDLSHNQAYGSQDVDGVVLGQMSETIATAFPALTPPMAKKN
jgi:hypothetical protein